MARSPQIRHVFTSLSPRNGKKVENMSQGGFFIKHRFRGGGGGKKLKFRIYTVNFTAREHGEVIYAPSLC